MIGVIRVFTTADEKVLHEHGRILADKYGLEPISRCIPDQPFGIHSEETEQEAIPKIVQVGQELVADGCRVLVVSCAADPAVEELRQAVSVPVIGAGSAAALLARGMGAPVGMLGILEQPPQVMQDLIGDKLVGYAQPEGVTNTTDLLTPMGREKALEAVRGLLVKGAKTIVFACTGYSTIGLADTIRQELQVPVVDAVEAEGLFTAHFLAQGVTM